MNRRDALRCIGAGGLAALGIHPERANAAVAELPIEIELQPLDTAGASLHLFGPVYPALNHGDLVCETCTPEAFWPQRYSANHVASRFINHHERMHTNVFLHGEKQLRVYEVFDGAWAFVAHENERGNPQLCPICRESLLMEYREGPYEVRRTEGFDPVLAGLMGGTYAE